MRRAERARRQGQAAAELGRHVRPVERRNGAGSRGVGCTAAVGVAVQILDPPGLHTSGPLAQDLVALVEVVLLGDEKNVAVPHAGSRARPELVAVRAEGVVEDEVVPPGRDSILVGRIDRHGVDRVTDVEHLGTTGTGVPAITGPVEVPLVPGTAGECGVRARSGRGMGARDCRGVEVGQVDDRELAIVTGAVGVVAIPFVDARHRVGAVPDGDTGTHVGVRRVGDIDDEKLTAANVDVLDVGAAGLVEVGAHEDESLDDVAAGAALAIRHGLVLEDEVVDGAGELRVPRVAGVEDADAVKARRVEVRAGLGERGRDHACLVGHGADEPDAGTHHQGRFEALLTGRLRVRAVGGGHPGGEEQHGGAECRYAY